MKKTFKRSVSFVLAFAMVLGIFGMISFTSLAANDYNINSTPSTDDYYNLISKKDWDIAPGITESEIVLNNDAGTRRQVLFVMEADLNNEYVKVTHSYTGMIPQYGSYTTGVMSKQAAWAEANGYGNVVGAMNTCLSWYTGYAPDRVGEPLGFMMLDAEIVFDPGNCGYNYGNVGFPSVVVINKDFDENGNPRPADIPKVEMPQIRTAADLDGWEDQVIPCSSGYIVKDGINQYANKIDHSEAAPRSVVGIKPDGSVVIMLNDGRQSPYSVGMSMYELAEVMLDLGCSFAVNCDGGGSSTYLSQRPGEDLKVNNSPSDGAERPTTSGIFFISTAPADGTFYKAHVSTENTYYTPNSAIQFNAIGTDMVGNEVEIPAEAQWILTDPTMGEIDNNGLFVSSGKEGEVVAQIIYNGKVAGEAAINIVTPEIRFKNQTIVIGYGDSTPIPVELTTNEGRNEVTYKEGDIVYTLSDENLGTIVGDTFTACDESTGLTGGSLTAVLLGQTDKAITAEIRFGKASEIIYDFEDDEFIYDEDPGVAPAEGEPYGWAIMDSRRASYYPYRYYTYNSKYTPVTYDIDAKLYRADANSGLVRNGNGSMGVDIRWTNTTSSCHGQMLIFLPDPIDLTDATSVGFWIYIPSEMVTDSMEFKAYFLTNENKSAAVTHKVKDLMAKNPGVDNGGWYYVSWEVLDYYSSVRYFEINSHYQAGEGNYNYYQNLTYYIDDITVDYSDATIDRENPYFTSMTIADEYTNGVEINGQTITTNTIDLMAQAYENTTKVNATGLNRNSVKLYVDGVLSNAPIQISAAGTIGVSGLYLNDGAHTFLMEISDNQGNVGTIVRKLVVNTEKSAVRLEVPGADLLPTGSIVWASLVAEDLASIESVTTTVTLDYVNEWELDYMEVAYGFEAEYYIDHNHNAVITFTRTGTEVADTDVLAKLPIRIWMARGWMDDSGIRGQYISNDPAKQDKYMILTPHAMWYSDGVYDYRLVVGAEAGVVNYVDGSSITFSALNTVVRTEMNRYYTNTNKQNKWAFHICVPGEAQSKAATCTESGYENRVYCVGCACETVENLGHECDNHAGCGSPIEWGTTIPALGHTYAMTDGKLACVNGGELFTGIHTDGKTYVDGVVVADGWNAEGTAYYVDGVKLTGSHIIDKAVYTFDDNGTYLESYIYNGFITDEGVTMYFYTNTNYEPNYLYIDNTAYYFVDGVAKDGTYILNGETCLFEDGVYISCSTADLMDAGWMGVEVTYVVYADGSMILGGEGATYKYTSRAQLPWVEFKTKIRSVFVGKGITALNQFSLADIYYAKTITFEEDSKLTYIGAGAILSCYGITEIVLPEALETIVQNAFKMCKNLVDIYLPYGVKYLHKLSFVNNQNVPMPQVKLHLYEGTYAENYAKEHNIPYEYRTFVDKVVANGTCGAEASWELYKSGKLVISGSGAMADFTSKDTTPWAAYIDDITEVVIGKDITHVGNFSFAYVLGIKAVTFEEGSKLQTIGAASFLYNHLLKEIVLPATVTKIGNNAFSYCKALVSMIVPQDVTLIYTTSFTNCTKLVLNVAEGTYAEKYAITYDVAYTTRPYEDSVITSGTCGDNATWTLYKSGKMVIAGSGAIANYSSKEDTPWASYLTKITSIEIGKDITRIGNFAFAYATNVKTLTFEEGSKLETIGAAGFLYLHYVTEIVLPETVTNIGNNAFSYCKALVNITIPQDVTLIYPSAFTKCTKVVLNVAEGTYALNYAINNGLNYTTRKYVDVVIASGDCGEDASWSLYKSGKMIISGTGAMDNYTSKETTPWYEYLTKITSIEIGKDITHVGNFAFAYATNVKTLTFEEGSALQTVGAASFLYLHYVSKVVLPETVTKIGNNAFAYCKALVSINVPASVTLIYNASFNKCNANLKLTVAEGSYAERYAIANGIAYIYA